MHPYQNKTIYRSEIKENLRLVRSVHNGNTVESDNDAELIVTDDTDREILRIRESTFETSMEEFIAHCDDASVASSGSFNYHFFITGNNGKEAYLYVGYVSKEQYRMCKKIFEKELRKSYESDSDREAVCSQGVRRYT